jgi:carbamoyltransferase
MSPLPSFFGHVAEGVGYLGYIIPQLGFFLRTIFNFLYRYIMTPLYQQQFIYNVSRYLQTDQKKFMFANHHLCHAYAAFYGFVPRNKRNKPYAIVTLDGEGDGMSGSVHTFKKGQWRTVSIILGSHSLAKFYELITHYLGMKRNEHEYKVMGLAPYANQKESEIIAKRFDTLFTTTDSLQLHSSIPTGSLLHFFNHALKRVRFDTVAGAAQLYVEKVTLNFIKEVIEKTKSTDIVVGGGFFMNVKVNQKIREIKNIHTFTPCASAADESIIFGAAYYGYQQLCQQAGKKFEPFELTNLYLGPAYGNEAIDAVLKNDKRLKSCTIRKVRDIELTIARLLAKGHIVGRFSGRMEWGARALGNRSILMDPRRLDLKKELNDHVKSRDFWMPFAATIIEPDAKKYLKIEASTQSPYMMISFDTHPKHRADIAAAVHPADGTCRAQILRKSDNPNYYRLIQSFKKATGVGAVLNTSFNYHGEPLVCTPSDALHTFFSTGLQYLAIGSYLIQKK